MKPLLARWRPAIKAVGTNTFTTAAAALVALVSNVLISRELGPSARGEVAFVLQLAYLVAPFLLFGVDRQALRSETQQDAGRLTRHLVPVTAVVTILFLVVFRSWYALAPVIALAASWLAIRRGESLRDSSFQRFVKAYIAYQATVAALVLVLFFSGNTDWHWWLLPYSLPAVAVVVVEVSKNWRLSIRDLFGHLNRTSLQLLPAAIATIVVMRTDRLLMPSLSSMAQLGLYAAIATATEPIYWIAQALADHRASRFPPGRSIKGLVRSLAVDSVLFALVAAAAGVVITVILIPLLGPAFASTGGLVIPLSMAAVVLALYRQVQAWHLGGPNPGIFSAIEVATAIFALPCYWFAIASGGALGAAWGSLAVYAFGGLLSLVLAILKRGDVQHAPLDRSEKEAELS